MSIFLPTSPQVKRHCESVVRTLTRALRCWANPLALRSLQLSRLDRDYIAHLWRPLADPPHQRPSSSSYPFSSSPANVVFSSSPANALSDAEAASISRRQLHALKEDGDLPDNYEILVPQAKAAKAAASSSFFPFVHSFMVWENRGGCVRLWGFYPYKISWNNKKIWLIQPSFFLPWFWDVFLCAVFKSKP